MTYMLSEEQQLLRETVRELAEAKIAPAAADVDANARFPQEALERTHRCGTARRAHPRDLRGRGRGRARHRRSSSRRWHARAPAPR